MAKFNILNKAEKVVSYVFTITEKSPKHTRGDMVPTFRNESLDMIRNIVHANSYQVGKSVDGQQLTQRKWFQEQALLNLTMLDVYAEICFEHNHYITFNQFDYLTTLIQELRLMIERWIQSDKSRCQ